MFSEGNAFSNGNSFGNERTAETEPFWFHYMDGNQNRPM